MSHLGSETGYCFALESQSHFASETVSATDSLSALANEFASVKLFEFATNFALQWVTAFESLSAIAMTSVSD